MNGISSTISTDTYTELKQRVDLFTYKPHVYKYGVVSKVSDGVTRIRDLSGRCYGELLEFSNGVFGMVMDLEEFGVGAVILNAGDTVSVGDTVRGTGHTIDIPVGNCLLGRVIDPIGKPLDGKPLIAAEYYPVERKAPSIIDRSPVNRPLETGILAIDSMIPIGRGQRELIIGDRQTGKTTIALDTILNQKGKDVLCIYCAIGQKASNIAQTIQKLTEAGAMDYSLIVASTASDSAAMQYLAPYAACSVAEYFMEKGRDVLVVYDDLSKHAIAYRTMSLLLHRPPGREAYPGDVFYLHSRLLERSAQLSQALGGGSMTALPIIETMGGNISAYIPTNVISITDGQIYLESELFHSGIRPAVNTGLSVSRVGRSAQHPAMRAVSGSLRIELAQYREMAVFARFGSDIDETTKELLARGECLTYLLNQKKGATYSLAQQVLLLLAFQEGTFANIPAQTLPQVVLSLFAFIRKHASSAEIEINSSGSLSEEVRQQLKGVLAQWSEMYEKSK